MGLGLAACTASDSLPTSVPVELDRAEEAPVPLRGIYVNARVAGSPEHLQSLLDLADGSEVNAFVIDVKDGGEVSFASTLPLVAEIGADGAYIDDLSGLLATLHDHGIRAIARIVTFRDPVLAEARPEWAIQTADGGLWIDPESGRPFVDPYNAEVWSYNIGLAREALEAGFAEVQWDYVRFPDVSSALRATMVFPARDGRSPEEAIRDFIHTSRLELADLGAPVTANVFGRVITETGGSGIGQEWDRLVRVTDLILPMVYPSMYWPGNFGVAQPGEEPYRLVRAAMDSATARLRRTPGATARLRPWLQAFSHGGTTYGPGQIRDQIRAVEDAGLDEWLFWNRDSVYPAEAF